MMEGLTLVASGAKAEGLMLFRSVASDLDKRPHRELAQILLSHYARSLSVDTAVELADEVENLTVRAIATQPGVKT